MLRTSFTNHELNTITLSNNYLWDIYHSLSEAIDKCDKEIKACKKKGMSQGVVDVWENIKNKYVNMRKAIDHIAFETETQFNFDDLMKRIEEGTLNDS